MPAVRSVVAIVNQKGGVGKSTTAINLAAFLAEKGKRILVVDMDPQGNATSGLGVTSDSGGCMYDVLLEGKPLQEVAVRTGIEGLDVAPATINLVGAEVELVASIAREFKLKRALEKLPTEAYDMVLLDCPPSLDLLTLNALTAADELLIPIQCEYYALEGLTQLMQSVKMVREELNPGLEV
jgi:chromosome partitioning protein